MSAAPTCSAASLAAGEPLEGTATGGTSWLLVEVRGAWGRDAIVDSGLPLDVRDALGSFPGKVILIRRPDRRHGATVVRARVEEAGGTIVRQVLGSLAELPAADLEQTGEPIGGSVVLVCAHGRRDSCCARLGLPLFEALPLHVAPDRLWQASHLGGHRFAPNVLVLPEGVQLGRIPVERADEVGLLVADGRLPLDLYRGRTLYAPPVQAAEIAVRSATGYDRLTDLRFVCHEGDLVRFATPTGEHVARVEERPGPVVSASCGAEPEQTVGWLASLVG